MPHDLRPHLPGEDSIATSLRSSQRSCKRKRTPSIGAKRIADEAAETGEAESDSSDWEDWADAQVAQGDPMDETEKNEVPTNKSGVASAKNSTDAEEEAWMRGMMDQGTDGSVVQEMDTKAWEYVLQVAVEADKQVLCCTLLAPVILYFDTMFPLQYFHTRFVPCRSRYHHHSFENYNSCLD